MKKNLLRKYLFLVLFISSLITYSHAQETSVDLLPSWNNGVIKQAIIHFVKSVTDKNSPDYVLPEDRIATFDNDGTLWVEQPMYTQLIFSFDRIKAMSSQHPEWKNQEPFKSVLNHQYEKLKTKDLQKILAVTHSGMTVETYHETAKKWLETAKNPRFQHIYPQLTYQPMLEVMNYLRKNNFKIYIVSGGGQDFMRAFAPQSYGVDSENIIGSSGKTKYVYQNKIAELIKLPSILLIDDAEGKPQDIYLFIGKKPLIAFGNSDGDRQMLEWTESNAKKHLMLLVHHDDAKREYAYGPHSKVGTFSQSLMNEANQNGWYVISMKNDWKKIFSF